MAAVGQPLELDDLWEEAFAAGLRPVELAPRQQEHRRRAR